MIQQVKGNESAIPAFVRPWEEILETGPCLLAHCPIGIGIQEWLLIAPAGGLEKPFPFNQHPKVRVIRHWTYLGHEIYVLDAPSVGQVTFAFAGSVLFCSPRTLLVEEALERKGKRSSSTWVNLLQGREYTGTALFWNSRHSEKILPGGIRLEGFLGAPHQFSADSAWISFSFAPLAKTQTGELRPFPIALAGLVPEDVAVFDWPFPVNIEKGKHSAWRRFFAPWAKSDPGFARLPGQDSSSLVILEVSGSTETVSQLLKSYAAHFGILKSYAYQSFRIVQVMDQSVPEVLSMASNRPACLMELEGYVLLSNRPEALERWADFYRIGAMLDRKLGPYLPALNERAISWRYLSPFQPVPAWLSSWLPGFPAALSWLGKEGSEWKWNVAPVGKDGDPRRQGNILWRKSFPSSIRRFFPLPGSAVVAVQDETNQLYFLDHSNGAMLWNKKLDGSLLSDIFPVHIPSLNQRGWLMNTRSAVYLFSEDGNLTAGYPLLLRAPASAGLTFLPEPESDGGAYYFPSENRCIYGYSLEGTPLNAWSPGPKVGDIAAPLICFPFAGKNYIAGYSIPKGFFALNPIGEDHFQPVAVRVEGFPMPVADPTSPTPRFAVFDGRGRAQVINLQGAHFPLRVAANPGMPSQSLFADFSGDHRKDFLSLQGNQLQLSGYAGNTYQVFWSQRLETPADTLILVDKPGKKWAALGRAKPRTLHLLDGGGKEMAGSPVGGSMGLKWTDSGVVVSVLDNQIIAYQLPKSANR
ncbi:MAG: PQQ-binding-like beta-propeller repeat protein [Haliscomenobacter sp.]|nr:PQQ-binding-like beta-propeller repeat protein [Haliscomenobacter sp.]